MKCKGDARFWRTLCAVFAGTLAAAGMTGAARAQSAFDPVVTQVSIGSSSACAVTASGGVKCWGAGSSGQLGGNSTAIRSTPFDVAGLAGAAVSVRVGAHHACALMVTGSVKCWGANDRGQLGNHDATHSNSLVPVTVMDAGNQPILGVAAIATGEDHTCALTTTGTVDCWGANDSGQLGDGSYNDSTVPVAVIDGTETPITNVVSLVAGGYHNCALTLTGPTQCWGYNSNGQLGNSPDFIGSVSYFAVPVVDASVRALAGATLAAGRSHTCALGIAGGAKCWGFNGVGELGNNTYFSGPNPDPSPVVDATNVALTGFAELALGSQHTCARTIGGSMKCWGYNGYGELGRGPDFYDKTPQAVVTTGNVPIGGVAATAAGGYNTCATTAFGGVRCWGDNRFGKDGNGIITGAPAVVIGLGAGTKAVATGFDHTCALTISGGVLCWGDNSFGQLGNHSTTSSFEPVAVSGLGSGVLAVAAGNYDTCALTNAGAVVCWGKNSFGKLGNNDPATEFSDTPVAVVDAGNVPLSGATAIAVGGEHACALIGGGVKCWGVNYSGQLGNHDFSLPQAFAGSVVDAGNVPISGVAALAAGANHSCAVTASTGGARCWGDNYLGALGNNDLSVIASSIPLAVVDASYVPVTGFASIAAGFYFNCAMTTSHGVKCWGAGASGELGGGAFADSLTPADVVDSGLAPITGVSSVTAGAEHACVTTLVSGAVACWGYNFYGELANPSESATNVAKAAVDGNNSPIVGAATSAGCNE
jgi:alpha-tubulin suppressor-like RCC1 family protein